MSKTPKMRLWLKRITTTPLTQYVVLESGNQIMFTYLGLSNSPLDYDNIATSYSQDYRSTGDAFKKKDILDSLKPRIDAEIAKAKNTRYIRLDEQARLGAYDFNAKAFPVQNQIEIGSNGYFNDNTAYRYAYTNGDNFKMLHIADEATARKIEGMKNSGQLTLAFYGFWQETDPSNKSIKCQIVKVRLLDRKGNELLVQ